MLWHAHAHPIPPWLPRYQLGSSRRTKLGIRTVIPGRAPTVQPAESVHPLPALHESAGYCPTQAFGQLGSAQ